MKKPRLLILSPGFPANEQDSTCLPALRMFLREEALQSHFEVRVISLHYPFDRARYVWHGIPVRSLQGKNKKGLHRIPLYLAAFFHLKKNISKERETLVLSVFATEAAFVASHFCRWHRIKHFCWIMGQDAKRENRFIHFLAKRTHFLVMSEFLKNTFETNFTHQVLGLVPSALYLPDLPPFKVQERTRDFIAVGSLISLKRFEWVLQVIRDLRQEGIFARAVILGQGPEKNRLQELAQGYGIEKQVEFPGEISQNEVIEEMMKSKILLHPSTYEGFGNVLIEALYAGCHVVSLFDPLTVKVSQMHLVSSYSEFLKMSHHLLSSTLQHDSHTGFNTKESVKEFIALSQSIGNAQ